MLGDTPILPMYNTWQYHVQDLVIPYYIPCDQISYSVSHAAANTAFCVPRIYHGTLICMYCAGGEADEAQVQEDNEDVTTKEDAKPDGLVSAYWETIGL